MHPNRCDDLVSGSFVFIERAIINEMLEKSILTIFEFYWVAGAKHRPGFEEISIGKIIATGC